MPRVNAKAEVVDRRSALAKVVISLRWWWYDEKIISDQSVSFDAKLLAVINLVVRFTNFTVCIAHVDTYSMYSL